MNRNKVLLNIGLSIILVLLVTLVFKTTDTKTKHFISGLVKEQKIDSKKLYEQTIVDTYDPEPNWAPKVELGTANEPFISGKAGFLIDINSGNIVYSKNPKEQLPIASLTKIMTAVVALEHKKLGEKIYVNQEADEIGENTMNLDYGEIYTLEELMYGLMLNSGNDAAYAIAIGVAGDKNIFVEWMNIKAKELGLTNTIYTDPSGLDDGNISSVEDLTKLTRYAMKNPNFKRIVGTKEYELPSTDDHKYVYLDNQTNLLRSYPGVEGVKTGLTDAAGLCLVTYAKNEGKELVGAVLGSSDRKGDMILMLDHGYGTLGVSVQHD